MKSSWIMLSKLLSVANGGQKYSRFKCVNACEHTKAALPTLVARALLIVRLTFSELVQ